jgi:hypothetical protein
MNAFRPLAVAAAVAFCCSASANPFEGLKAKTKAGLYEYKMEMDMGAIPGMPPGMGKQNHTFQRCLTQEEIDKGQMGRGRDGKMPENCEVRDFKMSGNTASYTTECKGEHAMKVDNKVTFTGDGYDMDMKMAMTQGGQTMNMHQKMNARYLGACKK